MFDMGHTKIVQCHVCNTSRVTTWCDVAGCKKMSDGYCERWQLAQYVLCDGCIQAMQDMKPWVSKRTLVQHENPYDLKKYKPN